MYIANYLMENKNSELVRKIQLAKVLLNLYY